MNSQFSSLRFFTSNDVNITTIKKIFSDIITPFSLKNETEKNNNGYKYNKELGMSIQGVDANTCIYEIMLQCLLHNYDIEMLVELETKKQIKVKYDKIINNVIINYV